MNPTVHQIVTDAAPSMVKTIIVLSAVNEAIAQIGGDEAQAKAVKGCAIVLSRLLADAGVPEDERIKMAEQVDREWAMRRALGDW